MAYIAINQMAVLDPCLFLDNVMAMATASDRQWLDITNRLDLAKLTNRWGDVSGPNPSYGYFAVTRKIVNAIKDKPVTLYLQSGSISKTQKGLMMVRATGMEPLAPTDGGDDSDMFVVELADYRYYGAHPQLDLDFPGFKLFNAPAPAYGQDQLYDDTINPDTGEPWTWQEMFDELWPDWMPGDPPQFTDDQTPNSIPIGFDFRSFTNYQAITIVLNYLTLSLALDIDGSYYLTNSGTEDQFHNSNKLLFDKYSGARDEEVEWSEPVSTFYPKGVRVIFQKTSTNSGSENVFIKAPGQWYADMEHIESVDAGDDQLSSLERSKLLANTYHQIWDDMPAWVDPYTGVLANATDIAARGQFRMEEFYANLVKKKYRRHGILSEMVPLDICGTLQACVFVQQQTRGGAWTTEYWCHPNIQAKVEGGKVQLETVKPISPYQWRSAPIYPPETMLWRNDGFLTSGSSTSTSDDEYNGHEIRYDPATKTFKEGIYVKGVPTP